MQQLFNKIESAIKNPVILLFVILSLIVTLYPPTSWGNEYLLTEESREKYINYQEKIKTKDVLPIFNRSFLFGDSKKDFTFGMWGYRNQKSYLVFKPLNRTIIYGELILNYIFVGLLAYLLTSSLTFIKRFLRNKPY